MAHHSQEDRTGPGLVAAPPPRPLEMVPNPTGFVADRSSFMNVPGSRTRPPEMFQNAAGFYAERSHFINVQGGMHLQNPDSAPLAFAPAPGGAGSPVRAAQPSSRQVDAYSDNEVYCSELCHRGRGYPLYVPEPQDNLPQEYRTNGVAIGDLGWVTPEGTWDFLFNIFLAADDPINGNRVPDGFCPLTPYSSIDVRSQRFGAGDHVFSPSVQMQNREIHGDHPRTEYLFDCNESKGAILALPHGSLLKKLLNVKSMREYATQHAESWYRYTNETRGRCLVNGGLYLITGCEKSRTGGMATYQNVAPGNDFSLAFQPFSDRDGNNKYRFSGSTRARIKTFSQENDVEPLNNTIFLHGFTISLGEGLWGRLFGNVGISEITDVPFGKNPGGFVPFGPHGTGSFSFSLNFFAGGGGAGGKQRENVRIADLAPTSKMIYPSQKIHEILRQEVPHAKVVITHDDDWRDVLRDDDILVLVRNTREFRKRLFQCSRIVNAQGVVYLDTPGFSDCLPSSQSRMSSAPTWEALSNRPECSLGVRGRAVATEDRPANLRRSHSCDSFFQKRRFAFERTHTQNNHMRWNGRVKDCKHDKHSNGSRRRPGRHENMFCPSCEPNSDSDNAPHSQNQFQISASSTLDCPPRYGALPRISTSNILNQRRMSEPFVPYLPAPRSHHQQQYSFGGYDEASPHLPKSPFLSPTASLGSVRHPYAPSVQAGWKQESELVSPFQPSFSAFAGLPSLEYAAHSEDNTYGPSPPGSATSSSSSTAPPLPLHQSPQQQPQHSPQPRDSLDPSEKAYSLVALQGNIVRKRPRRRYDEIDRLYHCSWPDCNKAYGTLNHLNAHVQMQKHGSKRSANEFKELRKQWRKAKELESPSFELAGVGGGPIRRSMSMKSRRNDLYHPYGGVDPLPHTPPPPMGVAIPQLRRDTYSVGPGLRYVSDSAAGEYGTFI